MQAEVWIDVDCCYLIDSSRKRSLVPDCLVLCRRYDGMAITNPVGRKAIYERDGLCNR